MKTIYRKLKKIEAMALMINESERNAAMKRSSDEYEFRTYHKVMVEGVKHGGIPSISIYRSSVNKNGMPRSVSSWTDIPYDVIYDPWTYTEEFKDSNHKDFSSITTMLRTAVKIGFSGMKFGSYNRTVKSIDYLDFEIKQD